VIGQDPLRDSGRDSYPAIRRRQVDPFRLLSIAPQHLAMYPQVIRPFAVLIAANYGNIAGIYASGRTYTGFSNSIA
jgi:hypothetical protein